MKFSLFAVSVLPYLVNADNNSVRRLSFEKIAGYAPGSQVTDHCAIDLDQQAIEFELAKATDDSFALAKRIYNQGAHSKSYADITLSSGLTTSVNKGKAMIGKDSQGRDVAGVAFETYQAGTTAIRFEYGTSDIQTSYVNCQVGALGEAGNLDGCIAANGSITIEGSNYGYTYDPATNNDNGRTIAGFSTEAGQKMRTDCPGCPYTDFMYFKDYYGVDDYANQWVTAALDGTATSFDNGDADFSRYSFAGRSEAVKKGTVFMNIFMYVIREFEDALDDCKKDCIDCNDDPVHAWDEGVCFYTGSIEGKDGLTSNGKLLHQLADKRCINFKTCGQNSGELSGTAKVNYDLFQKYELGKQQLESSQCDAARITTAEVTKLMYIPFIQGTLRYAYKLDALNEGEKSAAEGATFAAAVLPRIHAASPEAAQTIYDNMKVGATSTSFSDVKAAFESVYSDLGITCRDIGGLWNEALDEYYGGMEPCGGAFSAATTSTTSSKAMIVAITGAAALFVGFF
ncbi:unnamed protein product [Cylindrotheca closterium]|uniref:Uncharacterized protein n=1 Tax=Cylindrotheca closterium TaxID=2856 RepID=A0AAD2FQ47_9STRA|nr:unnamed protein product [Cylindrotheca closterium]